jgi:multiple sugar transport system ATP-binding protein
VPYEAPAEIAQQLRELERELDSESLHTQLIVALDPASTIRSGSKAELWFDTERMHVFDPATGENLTRNRDRTSGDDQAAGVGVPGPPDETVSG